MAESTVPAAGDALPALEGHQGLLRAVVERALGHVALGQVAERRQAPLDEREVVAHGPHRVAGAPRPLAAALHARRPGRLGERGGERARRRAAEARLAGEQQDPVDGRGVPDAAHVRHQAAPASRGCAPSPISPTACPRGSRWASGVLRREREAPAGAHAGEPHRRVVAADADGDRVAVDDAQHAPRVVVGVARRGGPPPPRSPPGRRTPPRPPARPSPDRLTASQESFPRCAERTFRASRPVSFLGYPGVSATLTTPGSRPAIIS